MEVNKEEALRSLGIAQRKRAGGDLTAALRFANKSIALYPTPEAKTMVAIIEREIAQGDGEGSAPAGSSARTSGVEEHMTSAQQRHKKPAPATEKPEVAKAQPKREYTVKQLEVVTRIKRCRDHQYYEILAVERTCTESDVKRAYKKLALALHPDKNGAPGADEAFKMVSKAFQVLSDKDLRSVYDSNPTIDPTQRGGGGGGGMRGFSGGGHPAFRGQQFEGDISPEDLFNMFFGGGGGSPFGGARVYTFGNGQYGGPGRRARQAAGGAQEPQNPLLALLPVALLLFFVLFSLIPTMLSGDNAPDPEYRFRPSTHFNTQRSTWHRNINYHVNKPEWEKSAVWQSVPENYRDRMDAALFSNQLRRFERGVEEVHIRQLQAECTNFNIAKQRKIAEEAGIFGWGADYDKIRKLRAEKHPSCEQLKSWELTQQGY